MAHENIPPPPPGFVLDEPVQQPGGIPPPPPGFKLDSFGPTPGPFPPPKQKATLPDSAADLATDLLPAVGAGVAAAFTGGGAIPAILAAGAGGGVGSLVEQGERYLTGNNPPKNAKELGKRVLVDAGTNAIAEGAGQLVEKPLAAVLSKWANPERLYQSALRPVGRGESSVLPAVRGGLEEGIVLGPKAAENTSRGQQILRKQIEDIISSKPKNIPAAQWQRNVQAKFDALRAKWGRVAGKGKDYIAQIDDFERQFLLQEGNPRAITKQVPTSTTSPVAGPTGQPIQTTTMKTVTTKPEDMALPKLRRRVSPMDTSSAQRIKKSTYGDTVAGRETAYQPGVHLRLQNLMQKDVARALKEELELQYPQLKRLNAREGTLIKLQEQLEKFAQRQMNQSSPRSGRIVLSGLGAVGGGAFGYQHGGTPGALEGAAAGVTAVRLADAFLRTAFENPEIKSRLAIALKRAEKMPGKNMILKIGQRAPSEAIRFGAYEAGAGSNR